MDPGRQRSTGRSQSSCIAGEARYNDLYDIFAALSTVDENRLMDPIFVSGEPMNLPTVNLGEGDLKAIMSCMDKMEFFGNPLV